MSLNSDYNNIEESSVILPFLAKASENSKNISMHKEPCDGNPDLKSLIIETNKQKKIVEKILNKK